MDQEGEDMDVHMDTMEALKPNPGWSQGTSFKDKLMGKNGKDMKQRKPTVEIDLQEHDVLFGSENDMPTIKFSDRDRSIIVKLLGKSIEYKT